MNPEEYEFKDKKRHATAPGLTATSALNAFLKEDSAVKIRTLVATKQRQKDVNCRPYYRQKQVEIHVG